MHIKSNNNSEYNAYSAGTGSGYESGSGSRPGFFYEYEYNYSNEYDSSNSNKAFKFYIFIAFLICFVCLLLPYTAELCGNIKNKWCVKLKIECMRIKSINCYKCKLNWFNIKNKINPDSNDTIDNEICTICLSDNNNVSTTLNCHHTFHNQCINKWIDTSMQNNSDILCPLCRNIL